MVQWYNVVYDSLYQRLWLSQETQFHCFQWSRLKCLLDPRQECQQGWEFFLKTYLLVERILLMQILFNMSYPSSIIVFYCVTHMHTTDYAIARCLSVHVTHASAVSKRLNISSNFFHHLVDPLLVFSVQNIMAIFGWGTPNRDIECIAGDILKITIFDQYLTLSQKWCKTGVEFYLYPTVGTVLIHSVKPELTE